MGLCAVLFDIDGTLVDSNGLHVDAWSRAFEAFGRDVARDAIASQIGKGGKMLVEALVPGIAEDAAETIDERHGEIFKADFLAQARPFPRRGRWSNAARAPGCASCSPRRRVAPSSTIMSTCSASAR